MNVGTSKWVLSENTVQDRCKYDKNIPNTPKLLAIIKKILQWNHWAAL